MYDTLMFMFPSVTTSRPIGERTGAEDPDRWVEAIQSERDRKTYLILIS